MTDDPQFYLSTAGGLKGGEFNGTLQYSWITGKK